jgi:hypothetical protein
MNMGTLRKAAALALGACVLAFALTGCGSSKAAAATPQENEGGITVTASSEVKVVPDKARMSVSVVSSAKTAEECRSANTEKLDAVLKAISDLGIKDESVQTSYASLNPQYGSQVTDSSEDESKLEEWVITGYEMTTSLSISDLDIDQVGVVTQACVDAGADGSNGLEYYASNYDETYNEALAKAVADSKVKAEAIAKAAGVGVGGVTNVVEGYQNTSYRYANSYDMEMTVAEDDAGAAKTMPGQVSITAEVTVTYAIS